MIIIIFASILALIFAISLMLIFFNPYPLKFKDEIMINANKFDVQPQIVASVINAESGFNKDAISSSGALGLMQILPTTAEWLCNKLNKEFDKDILFNVTDNIEIGTYYLKYLFTKFNNLTTVLAAYNAGEGNVMLWLLNDEYSENNTIKTTPFAETNAYIKKVIDGLNAYKKKF